MLQTDGWGSVELSREGSIYKIMLSLSFGVGLEVMHLILKLR